MRLKCKFCDRIFTRLIEWKWHRDEAHGGVADWHWVEVLPGEQTYSDGEGI